MLGLAGCWKRWECGERTFEFAENAEGIGGKAVTTVTEVLKLFATRSEQYREQSAGDITQGTARAALAAIPIVGGSATELLTLVVAPSLSRRRDQWLKDLSDDLDVVEKKVGGIIEGLKGNEPFVSAAMQATRVAMATHQKEKLDALRNAIMNVALGKSLDEERQSVFLNLIDAFTVTHLELLRLFQNRATFSPVRMDELRKRREITDPMVIDLSQRGLLMDPRPYVSRTRESEESLTVQGWTLSELGKEFMEFIHRPDEVM